MSREKNYLCKYNFGEDYQLWTPWKGCYQVSPACDNCYVTPHNRFKDRYYPFKSDNLRVGTFISVCLQSDFFLREADKHREKAWAEIRNHPDQIFLIITKRPERILEHLPEDWGDGWDNVILCVTAENQAYADARITQLMNIPAKHRWVTCSPLLEKIDLSRHLATGKIEHVEATGERKCQFEARPTEYFWAADLYVQCIIHNVRFSMLYLGNNFVMPDGEVKEDWSWWYRSEAADALNMYNYKPLTFHLKSEDITY
jgi:protein gp37